jgi:hypothetical protein
MCPGNLDALPRDGKWPAARGGDDAVDVVQAEPDYEALAGIISAKNVSSSCGPRTADG